MGNIENVQPIRGKKQIAQGLVINRGGVSRTGPRITRRGPLQDKMRGNDGSSPLSSISVRVPWKKRHRKGGGSRTVNEYWGKGKLGPAEVGPFRGRMSREGWKKNSKQVFPPKVYRVKSQPMKTGRRGRRTEGRRHVWDPHNPQKGAATQTGGDANSKKTQSCYKMRERSGRSRPRNQRKRKGTDYKARVGR